MGERSTLGFASPGVGNSKTTLHRDYLLTGLESIFNPLQNTVKFANEQNSMRQAHNIAISCIGSGVGQSVITSCRLSRLPLRTTGLGTNPFAFGLYECDAHDYTPAIYAGNYIDTLIEKCKEHRIHLLIPGLDDEAHLIAKAIHRFRKEGIEVIVAGEGFLDLCRDKERMTRELNPVANIFVKSYSKQDFIDALARKEITLPVIAKPRSGSASRGIVIVDREEKIGQITDAHIVQELAVPHAGDPNRNFYLHQLRQNINPQVSELSIQLVTDKNGDLLGRTATYNKLNNGIPIEIIPFEDEAVWAQIDKLYPTLKERGMSGPVNLQGRLTDTGLKIFEVNARFTGITGMRALMGFNEVESCVKHWLGMVGAKESLRLNNDRFGVRQTTDKVIPVERNQKVSEQFLALNKKALKDRKVVLITGASGYLAQNLIANLHLDNQYEVWAFSRNKEKAKSVLPYDNMQFYDKSDWTHGRLSLGKVDILVHAGFARPHCSLEEIADSLSFTGELFAQAVLSQVPAIVNISSQSVYGLQNPPPWKESSPVAPMTPYAQAKYASELLLLNAVKMSPHVKATSLRLSTITGGQPGLVITDLVAKFAHQALQGEPIYIEGGAQKLERMDVRDAVQAIGKVLKERPALWKPVYNLGLGKTYTILGIAHAAVAVARVYNNGKESSVHIEAKDVALNFGMDNGLFKQDFQWQPEYDLEAMLESLMEYYFAKNLAPVV